MTYVMSPAERAARHMDTLALKGRRRRIGLSSTRHSQSVATRAARSLDRKLGIAPQRTTRASRMLAAERRKAIRGDAPSHPHF